MQEKKKFPFSKKKFGDSLNESSTTLVSIHILTNRMYCNPGGEKISSLILINLAYQRTIVKTGIGRESNGQDPKKIKLVKYKEVT